MNKSVIMGYRVMILVGKEKVGSHIIMKLA